MPTGDFPCPVCGAYHCSCAAMRQAAAEFVNSRFAPLPVPPPHFYDATKWVPANGRHVLRYSEWERQPIHEVVYYSNGNWYGGYDNDMPNGPVTRWTELPYPADATNPPSFEVIPLVREDHESPGTQ